MDDQVQSHTEADRVTSLARPAQELLSRLQDERRLTAVWQTARTGAARADLDAARKKTDTALSEYHRQVDGADTATLRRRAGAFDSALASLAQRRSAVDARRLSPDAAFAYFTDAAAQGLALLTAAVRSDDGTLERAGTATVALAQITEMLAREDALVSAALPARRIPEAGRVRFGEYLGFQRAARTRLIAEDLPGDASAAYARITSGTRWATVGSVEDAVSGGRGTALPQRASDWPAAAGSVVGDTQTLEATALEAWAGEASDRADDLLLATLLGTAATLAALAGAAVLALRTRRSAVARLAESDRLAEQLSALRSSAEHLAAHRLPEVLGRIERGERIDPAVLTPRRSQEADEIGRLYSAVDQLAYIAAQSTLRQSRGREGSDKVVGQLIRRAQVLIHRLIALLDDLERKHEDSDLLKDIFRVDHLATRVRRHAENLMILSGAPPSRRTTQPVALTDVMRSAVAETEQYTRVRVKNTPADRRVALAGRAVADVTHLLAELIENGTSFSPPDTQVTVSTTRVAKGLAVHVEDQGLGMPADLLERANRLLAEPPRVDMTVFGDDPRLGHFVVARLAERHGIKVVLRESDYGGTLALVVIPVQLLEETSSPVVDQLQSAAVAAGRAVESGPEPQLTGAGQRPAAAGHDALTGVGARATGAESAIVHTALPDHNGFPEYGGAGLLPPASEHPATSVPEPASPIRPAPPTRPTHPAPPAQPAPAPSARRAEQAGAGAQPFRRTAAPSVQSAAQSPARPPAHAPARQTPDSSAEPGAPDTPRSLTTPSVLPQRVRGASLAQQLRSQAAQAEDEPGGTSDDDVISPHASARAMSAIHQGLKRAWSSENAQDAEDDDTAHGAYEQPSDAAGPTAPEL
ncbi:nitrate- and nitrite sensing domain-containing protein [Streptomyces sp. NPDC003393]